MITEEEMDYKLSRLKKGGSCKKIGDTWAYLDSNGTLHKLVNQGYYFEWKTNMWVSSFWNNENWGAGEISDTKKRLIQRIENENYSIKWVKGYGKVPAIEEVLL
jgi:hypothetical protein